MFASMAQKNVDFITLKQVTSGGYNDPQEEVIASSSVEPTTISNLTSALIPMVLIFMVFYFLIIRPQEQKRLAKEKLIASVKMGEEVLTHTGIYGTISQINNNDQTIMIQIANNLEIKMLKSSIADIISRSKVTTTNSNHTNTHKNKKNSSTTKDGVLKKNRKL